MTIDQLIAELVAHRARTTAGGDAPVLVAVSTSRNSWSLLDTVRNDPSSPGGIDFPGESRFLIQTEILQRSITTGD